MDPRMSGHKLTHSYFSMAVSTKSSVLCSVGLRGRMILTGDNRASLLIALKSVAWKEALRIMKSYVGIVLLTLLGCAAIVSANDLAFYSGPTNPGWISDNAVAENVRVIRNDPGIKALFDSIEDFGDGDEYGNNSPLAKWCIEHTGNGQQDVIILACGTTPSALYPFPNLKPDDSNIENFIEEGNVVINVADWIFYMSYEGGFRSPDNGPEGAANVFDIHGLSFHDRGASFEPTALGKKYIPSLKSFRSTRPWHLEQFVGTNWNVVVFAEADKNTADPAVAISKTPGRDGTGMIAAMWQTNSPVWFDRPDVRGIGVAEFIINWLAENSALDIEGTDKLTTTWNAVKNGNPTAGPSTDIAADVNRDGVVNIQDLVLIASHFGKEGQDNADVNHDGVVNIADLVLVAWALGQEAAAPSLYAGSLENLTIDDLHQWLSKASQIRGEDIRYRQGILMLEQLLRVLLPKESALLPNYPNPFNPETWIPYHLAESVDVTLTIYSVDGKVVRRLDLGHQPAGFYQSKNRAAYWDGRNSVGERVASGLYFYTLTAGDFAATQKMLILK